MSLNQILHQASSDLQDFLDLNEDASSRLQASMGQLIGKMQTICACYDVHGKNGGDIPAISSDWEAAYTGFVEGRGGAGKTSVAAWNGAVDERLGEIQGLCERNLAESPGIYMPRTAEISEVMGLTHETSWVWEEWEYEERVH
jgi:hypothetical protein